MFLIVGLGNIGTKYELTRHNVGFFVIDEMTKNLSFTSINKSTFQANVNKINSNLLVKPNTYMNNSGLSVLAIKNYYKIDIKNIIIIHDDLDLEFGSVKFKIGGSSGGHNGLKSIDEHIGKDYIRVRIGIGKPKLQMDTIHYVLSNFTQNELHTLKDIIVHTIQAVKSIQTESINDIKSKYTLKMKL